MPRFIDMTDAQKAQVWKRHIAAGGAGSAAAAIAAAEREVEAARAALAADPNNFFRKAEVRNAERRLSVVKETTR